MGCADCDSPVLLPEISMNFNPRTIYLFAASEEEGDSKN